MDIKIAPEHHPSPTPSRAIYGFVLYVTTYVLLGTYTLWAVIPDEWLTEVGLTYRPQKHWAITGPIYVCVSFVLFIASYVGLNLYNTPSLDSIYTIKDEFSRRIPTSISQDIPPPYDIPIQITNERYYGCYNQS
ncbi:Phosphatidylinositol N-acetylglucosaminyltransferase subunit P [Trichoplax sp. H2]|nr:Phosphatidylinositol N-acetylglucosaminyltransferase subunit P [Trichoplax sp. H2]|eukprot:RDD43271.1 Phosphatidylinositol N-acetylglucosaminyltransferase subunit P [Trichoplax sp. H2]